MTDLVVISLEVWDEVWRRNQHLVAGLLRRGDVKRVLFVEPAVDVGHDALHLRVPARTGLREVTLTGSQGRLWALRPHKVLPRRIAPRGDRRRAQAVVTAARRVGMRTPVLWVNDPHGAEVLDASAWPALYDITDDWLVADRPKAELRRLCHHESRLLGACSQVVVCSDGLLRTKTARCSLTLIPNAVDLEPYRTRQPRPSDLPAGLVTMYLGTAHRDRVDIDLLVQTANALAAGAGGNVVLVGPAPLPRPDLNRLRSAGVWVLGPRPSHTVPSYLQHADVLLVPHVQSQFTASLDPIKAYEYRAARRPVISTRVPGFVDVDDCLIAAVKPKDFAKAVVAAGAESVAWSADIPDDIPTWSTRVAQMADVLRRVKGERP